MSVPIKEILNHRYFKTICIVLGIIVLMFAMVWARAFYGSMKAFNRGESLLAGKEYIRAVTFYDRSIHWYTPLNPYVQRSAERLWEISVWAEETGDIKLALIACRTIRRGFYAASSVYQPGKNWIEKCDDKIDKLVLLEEKERGIVMEKRDLERLQHVNQKVKAPNIFWTIVLEIGFLGWIGSVIGFIRFVIGNNGERKHYRFIIWGGITVVFFSMWIVGMTMA